MTATINVALLVLYNYNGMIKYREDPGIIGYFSDRMSSMLALRLWVGRDASSSRARSTYKKVILALVESGGMYTVALLAGAPLMIIPEQVDIPLVKFSSISGSNDATSTRRSSVNFGTLGLCNLNVPQTTPTRTLADPRLLAGEISAIGLPAFSNSKGKTLNNLLNALILHQVAAGVAFIAFLLAVISHRIGFLLASAVAPLA
ncbi:hypothetical protein FRB96_006575 [Tulasnella sp. 330]|nr:hypothetical protein FRB96_006575 [Tulasnella sp. 330]KAG8868466.1 hypothetical protein FRB97_002362 [Tulasnella sp. 331]